MAGRQIFSKALSFFSYPSPPLRRHFSAAAAAISAGTPEIDMLKPAARSDSVLSVLQSRGLAAGDITGFDSHNLQDPAGDLGSKFDLLLGLGFSASDMAKILRNSSLLSTISLTSLRKRIEFLKLLVDDNGSLMKMIKKSIWTISASATIEKRFTENIAMLKEWGLADRKIRYLLVSHTRFLQLKSQSIVAAAETARTEFGVAHDDKMLIYHLIGLLAQSYSKREEKIRVFESFGWQSSDVHTLARTSPLCFTLSAAKLEKGLDFLTNTAGLSPSDIVSRPSMLGMSFEGRVSPRYHLIEALKSKCLVGKNLSLSSALRLTEKDFSRKFVDKFAELEPDACKTYMSRVTLPPKK